MGLTDNGVAASAFNTVHLTIALNEANRQGVVESQLLTAASLGKTTAEPCATGSSAVGSPPDPRVFSLLPTFPNLGSDTSLKTYLSRSGVKSQVDCVRVGDYPSDMRTDAALLKNRALFVLLAACDSTLADKGGSSAVLR